ncbi:phospholipase D-like domain-containing protein [Pacificimonas sp. ICDLI1SI03]
MDFLFAHVTAVIVTLGVVMATSLLLRQRRAPQASMAWLLSILLLPYVALPLFLLFGLSRTAQRKMLPEISRSQVPSGLPPGPAAALLSSYRVPPVSGGNRIVFHGDGTATWDALIEMVEGAEKSVWLATYVLRDGPVGGEVLKALGRRAEQGLDVRLLVDAAGSLFLPEKSLAPLRRAGGHAIRFSPIWRLPFRGRPNLRNHRKLLLCDERQVLAGGYNIAEEYLGPGPDEARWRELAFRLEGPAALDYAAMFRADWQDAKGSPLPAPSPPLQRMGSSSVQLVPSGPYAEDQVLFDLILSVIFAARERVWITTPYFIPDEAIARALELAARRGVDVRILVPSRSNHRIADFARGAYLRELEKANVRIYRYADGMVHGKAVIADDAALVGSPNLDFRSLFLNREATLVLYNPDDVAIVADWTAALQARSKIGPHRPGVVREHLEGVARLAAPLL